MQRNGKGKMYYDLSQDLYEGEWKLDQREGEGKMYIHDEKTLI